MHREPSVSACILRFENLERRDVLSASFGDFSGDTHVDGADFLPWSSRGGR
jgi:hypothetical protein